MRTSIIFNFKVLVVFLLIAGCGGGGSSDGNDDGNNEISKSLNGSLSESDEDIDGAYTDYYIVEDVPENASIWVKVDPKGFDAVVTLYYGDENDGEIIEESDDTEFNASESVSANAY